jgi:Domain of unknown function (DUF4386)
MERIAEASLRRKARIAGVLYLLYLLTPVVFGEYIKGFFVDGDAAATAKNILAHQPLWLGLATLLIAVPCGIAATALFYELFKRVDRSLSLLAAFFNLVALAIEYFQDVNIGSVLHGFYCLLVGYLIFRSTFLPRILGSLMAFAGLVGLTSLLPPLAIYLSRYIGVPGLLAELSLCLWLLMMGVNVQRWKEQVSSGGRETNH